MFNCELKKALNGCVINKTLVLFLRCFLKFGVVALFSSVAFAGEEPIGNETSNQSLTSNTSASSTMVLNKPSKQEALRDPTKPLYYAKKSTQIALDLQAIFYRDNNSQVVINGSTLTVGETIKGYIVERILKSSVRVRKGSSVRVLQLRPSYIN